MALLGYEGWEMLSGGPDLFNKPFGTGQGGVTGGTWSFGALGVETLVAGELGGNAYAIAGNQLTTLQLVTLTYPRLIVGMRIKAQVNGDIIWFCDQGTIQCGVSVNTAGLMYAWRTNPGGTVLATGTNVLIQNAYYYLEFDVTINNSTGSIKVVLNGSIVDINATNINTRNGSNNQVNLIRLEAASNVAMVSYDDFYIIDPSVGSPTTMLGITRVETLFPTSNSSVQWTPLTGTNFSEVNATTNNGGTSYNYGAIASVQDTFTHGSLVQAASTIYGVAVTVSSERTGNLVAAEQTTLISGATTQQGGSQTPTSAYLYTRDIYQTDPNTLSAWTAASVNATNIGYNRLS